MVLYLALMLVLEKCYDKKWFKSPFSCVILSLTQPQVANQQKKINFEHNLKAQAMEKGENSQSPELFKLNNIEYNCSVQHLGKDEGLKRC